MDWAAFLCEYSHCITPLPEGPTDWLPGNNVVYAARCSGGIVTVVGRQWENRLHDAMRRDGVPLVLPTADRRGPQETLHGGRVSVAAISLRAVVRRGARAGTPLAKRLGYGAAALALPPLLMFRTVSRVVAKRRYRVQLVRSLPLLAVFVVSWTAGEMVGYSRDRRFAQRVC